MLAQWRHTIGEIFAITLFVVSGFFIAVPKASADPHALFYTAVGQQQLFFNMLAALDQADYVEPALDPLGTSEADSRKELLDRRTQAGFGPEQDERVKQTETQLASILTRGITLEGNDLWTAFLTHQFALETARRSNVDQVVRIFCERGLGRKNCEFDQEDGEEKEALQKQAFTVDPLEEDSRTALYGILSVLDSNNNAASNDQQIRRDIIQEPEKHLQAIPYPFDHSIAAAREEVENKPAQSRALENAIGRVERTLLGTETISVRAFDALTIDTATQNAEFSQNVRNNLAGEDYRRSVLSALDNLLALPHQLTNRAQQGANEVAVFQQSQTLNGAVADVEPYPYVRPSPSPNGNTNTSLGPAFASIAQAQNSTQNTPIGSIDGRITVPAHVKVSNAQEAIGTLGSAEENLKYAPPRAENEYGEQQLVNRNSPSPQPGTQGIFTDLSVGQVQGIENSFNPTEDHHQDQTIRLSPNTNPTGIHHEQGPVHLLQALGYDIRGGCGCTRRTAVNHFGKTIIDKINSF